MPKVGTKEFPYTKQGVKDAKATAKKTGKKMIKKPMLSSDGVYMGQ